MHTVRDLMNRFAVTQGTVLGWIAGGELKAVNVGQKPGKKRPRWRISAAAIEAFEAARSTTCAAPAASRIRRQRQEDTVQFYPTGGAK